MLQLVKGLELVLTRRMFLGLRLQQEHRIQAWSALKIAVSKADDLWAMEWASMWALLWVLMWAILRHESFK